MLRPRRALVVLVAVLAAGLAGCSSTVSLQPGVAANDPACAEVMANLPSVVAGHDRRWTDAQSTAAWGDPATVILTCGVAELAATTLPCATASDVDWVIDQSEAPKYRLTTFDRTPAVEIYLDNAVVPSFDALDALSGSIALLPGNGRACTSIAG